MSNTAILKRQSLYLRPDPSRVILRPFKPATEPKDLNPTDRTRANHIVERVLELDQEEARRQLDEVYDGFHDRHDNLLRQFETRATAIDGILTDHGEYSLTQKQLVGAYFLHEYSFESAALFNPSIVLHPDQSGAPEGGVRIILSLRAVGEGHISSLTFRSGVITRDGQVTVDPARSHATIPATVRENCGPHHNSIDIEFRPQEDLSERVIFPMSSAQSNGIEDARFVAFEEDGETTYFATYTAYNGRAIRSELISTRDFMSFRLSPLRGNASHNKGMALFPRKIGGKYAMIGRQDNEHLHLLTSDSLLDWNDGEVILGPEFPWDFVQIGNCGAPIELDEGWLLLTHGVGPLRKYSIGATLLDKEDPRRVLGRTRLPLITPDPSEREGYVPNVVYTCGALRLNDLIVLPYAVCDTFCNFATISISDMLAALGA